MGFIQRFKDLEFLSECTRLMKKVAPATHHTAEFFCEDYKGYLLNLKDKGTLPLAALAIASKDFLNQSQELVNSGMSYGQYQALVDASHFARAIIELDHPLALHLKEPLHCFTLALQSEKGKKLLDNRAANV